MSEPISVGGLAGKAAMAALPITIKLVGQEVARRQADLADLDPTSLDKDLDEALDVLARAEGGVFKGVANSAKAIASGVPKVFEAPAVRGKLQQQDTRHGLKDACTALLTSGQDPDLAAIIGTDVEADQRELMIVAFDYAVAFACQTVLNKLTAGDRLVIARLDALNAKIERVAENGVPPAAASLSRELLDQAAHSAVTYLQQRRAFPDCALASEAKLLADRLIDGDLAGAANPIRAEGLAKCARWLSRGDNSALAPQILAQAERLGTGEEIVIARAFIAGHDAPGPGLAALAPINTPAKRSAALVIVGNAGEPADAIDWIDRARLSFADLDADGRANLLLYTLRVCDWPKALAYAQALTDDDFAKSPRGLHPAAIAELAPALTDDAREVLFNDPTLHAADLPLADTPDAVGHRHRARGLFGRAAAARQALDCPGSAAVSRSFELILGLRDPATHAETLQTLTDLVREGGDDIVYLPLALIFKAPVDRTKIDQALDQRDALEPGGSFHATMARITMANTAANAQEALAYFRRHRESMANFLLPDFLASMEVQLLHATGDPGGAQAKLDAAPEVPDGLRARLQAQIGAGPRGPSVESLEAWYAENPSVLTLRPLVEQLSKSGYSERWFALARELVQTTQTLSDAEAVARFLLDAARMQALDIVLEDVAALIPSSPVLRSAKAWSCFRDGRLQEAETLLDGLRAERDEHDDRALFFNLMVAAGRWDELAPFVEAQWLKRAERSAEELVHLGQLANRIGSPRAVEFARLAAAAAPDDAHLLVAAYHTASEGGVEDEQSASWINTALALSDENGPVTTPSLADLVDQNDDWNRHVDDIWNKVRAAALPLSLAAQGLRRTWLDLQLTPMLLNPRERDPRRRSVVPLFSGARQALEGAPQALALDGSAIVTLGVVGLLEALLAKPIPFHIPHATLSWLFDERHRLRFHQPSQIRRAEALVRDVSAQRLAVFAPGPPPPPALIDDVGPDLADMIAAAHAEVGSDQVLVVRPNPVHKLGSFLDEAADLSAYAGVLVSCSRVVDKLAEEAVLTAAEEAEARAFLAQQGETRWPDEPEIANGTTLLLDDLSISYLRTIKILDRLKAAGLNAEISARRLQEANAYAQLKDHTGAIEQQIEAIRETLAKAIAAGRVSLDRESAAPRDVMHHPNVAVIKLAAKVDIVASDERFINRNPLIVENGSRAVVWTSLDVIDWLHRETDIDLARVLEARTQLRRAGAIFVMPTVEELTALLEGATVKDGVVRDTVGLKAFRENLQMAQMRGWLQLPDEINLLLDLHHAIAEAILGQWSAGKDKALAAARSTWLITAYDPRNWSQEATSVAPTFIGRFGHAQIACRLALGGPSRAERRAEGGLDHWLETIIIEPLRENDPEAYDWMIAYMRDLVSRPTATDDGDDD